MKLDSSFYNQTDVTQIAKDLLGKVLVTNIDGIITSGKIVETEAYSYKEKACHAHMERRTNRTEVLFRGGGTAYVYLCYGIHKLFNVVTNEKDIAEAVLIRAVEPMEGLDHMFVRRNSINKKQQLTSGPGKLSEAMGIDLSLNKVDLFGDAIWIEDNNLQVGKIEESPRIGVAYALEDAFLPWRYTVKDNIYVSKGFNTYKM